MPLYEYHCEKCGRFETLQKFSEGPLKACPTCGAVVERLISAPAFQFKGTGWYVTDYAKSGAEASGSKETGAKESDSKSSEQATGTTNSKEASTPPSADSKSSTNSPPKEGTASAAPALAPAASTSQ
jgi:putative FmdB family regulatory protein